MEILNIMELINLYSFDLNVGEYKDNIHVGIWNIKLASYQSVRPVRTVSDSNRTVIIDFCPEAVYTR